MAYFRNNREAPKMKRTTMALHAANQAPKEQFTVQCLKPYNTVNVSKPYYTKLPKVQLRLGIF